MAASTIGRDNTERRRVEAALRMSEERYRGLFEHMAEGYAYCKMIFEGGEARDFIHLAVNAAFETLTGLKAVTGKRITEVIPGMRESDPELFATFARVALTGQPEKFEIFFTALKMWFSLSVYSPAQEFFVAVFEVITGRKQTEEQIIRMNERFALATRAARLGVWDWDIPANNLVWDDQMYELYGVRKEQFAGAYEAWLKGLHPDDVERSNAESQQALRGEKDYDTEFRVVWPDGTILHLKAYGQVIRDMNGNPVRMIGINHDITERVRAESQREAALEALRELNATLEQRVADRTCELAVANERLTEVDRLKDEFIARISHELYTPLVNIKLYLGLLDHGKPEKHAEYMETLRREAARLQQLIEDLLRISQLELDAARLQLEPIDVNQLLAQLVIDRSSLARERDLRIENQPAPDLPLALADATLLLQALSNLITNAVNYTPSGGTIMLNTALQPGDAQAWVTCTIRDSGPGISAKDLPHIFERFYRGEAAKDYTIPGTGLGLSICREIMEKMGGRITVASVPATEGSGAAFTVWLRPAD